MDDHNAHEDSSSAVTMASSYYDVESTHLAEAHGMAARGELLNAIRHAYWHGFHVGEQDGNRGATSTSDGAYEAQDFLLAVVKHAVAAGDLDVPYSASPARQSRTKARHELEAKP